MEKIISVNGSIEKIVKTLMVEHNIILVINGDELQVMCDSIPPSTFKDLMDCNLLKMISVAKNINRLILK